MAVTCFTGSSEAMIKEVTYFLAQAVAINGRVCQYFFQARLRKRHPSLGAVSAFDVIGVQVVIAANTTPGAVHSVISAWSSGCARPVLWFHRRWFWKRPSGCQRATASGHQFISTFESSLRFHVFTPRPTDRSTTIVGNNFEGAVSSWVLLSFRCFLGLVNNGVGFFDHHLGPFTSLWVLSIPGSAVGGGWSHHCEESFTGIYFIGGGMSFGGHSHSPFPVVSGLTSLRVNAARSSCTKATQWIPPIAADPLALPYLSRAHSLRAQQCRVRYIDSCGLLGRGGGSRWEWSLVAPSRY